jgi:hypothetical protein
MAEIISNCDADVKATRDDIDPGDNSYHCPKTGKWAELVLEDNQIVCNIGADNCRFWKEDPEKQ